MIKVIAIGNKIPKWVYHVSDEYTKRLRNYKVEFTEITLLKRGKQSFEILRDKEESNMLTKIPNNSFIIALDPKGQSFTTEKISRKFSSILNEYKCISILIGGPEGFSDNLKNKANMLWSLSDLTYPHPMVRVILAEQIYRIWTIQNNHPYHN